MYLRFRDLKNPHKTSTVTRPYGTYTVEELIRLTARKRVYRENPFLFKHMLNKNYWFDPDKEVTLNDFIDHHTRVMNADLSYPIIVLKEDNDVLDGLHRLIKAITTNVPVIDVFYLTKADLETLK